MFNSSYQCHNSPSIYHSSVRPTFQTSKLVVYVNFKHIVLIDLDLYYSFSSQIQINILMYKI